MADGRTMGELLGAVSEGTVQLVRQELRLARNEATQSLNTLRTHVTHAVPAAVLGVVIALGAMVALTIGLIASLSLFLLEGRVWLAAFIVAAFLGAAAMLALRLAARAVAPVELMPRTANTLRETAIWIEHPTRPDSLRDAPLAAATASSQPPISSATLR